MLNIKAEYQENYSIVHQLRSKISACIWLMMLLLIIWPANLVDTKYINNPADVATEFIILHNNDMHARFEQISVDSGKCTPELAQANKCYGGFARVAHEVRKYREEAKEDGPPVLYLNAGDTYTGTPWFAIFKDNITAAFLNALHPDAISLGNHEFDTNVEGLIPFLNNVNFPVVTANLDLRKVPELLATKNLFNSTILNVNGVQVGVIGYLTPETKFLTVKNNVEFYPEVEAINKESQKLTKLGVKIIIALGHSGYHMDQNIALKCPDVDIVIGGHTNTFLYNGTQPDAEAIEGPYPTIVQQYNKKQVIVVQAFAYTKYLGKLHVKFDTDGNLIEYDGTPILLDATIPREQDILDLLESYRPNVTALEFNKIGNTKVFLNGHARVCRRQECNLGNLVADSMVYARMLENLGGVYWTDAPIAFMMGGGIRNSIPKRFDGAVYGTDILEVLPFSNTLHIVRIKGNVIRKALEHSATTFQKDSDGGFLQFSGVQVTYDFNRKEGARVIDAKVLCAECEIPVYKELNETAWYKVIIPAYLLNGGDGYNFSTPNSPEVIRMKKTDSEALTEYFQKHEFVYLGIEGRITVVNEETVPEKSNAPYILLNKSIALVIISVYTLVFKSTFENLI